MLLEIKAHHTGHGAVGIKDDIGIIKAIRGLLYINNGEINTCIGRSRVYRRRFYGCLCGCGIRIRIPTSVTTSSAMTSSTTIHRTGDSISYKSIAKVASSAKKENSEKDGDTNTTPNFPQQFA
jgi:hypothetical protein